MKKVLFSVLAVLFLAACEGPIGPAGPPGRPGPPGEPGGGAIWLVFDINVEPEDWRHIQAPWGEDYLHIFFSVPELTREFYDNGAVMVFYEWLDGATLRQRPLPFSRPINDAGVLLTEYFDFDYSPGIVQFSYRITDFNFLWRPEPITFRVLFLW